MRLCECGRGGAARHDIGNQYDAVCILCLNERHEDDRARAFSGIGFSFHIPREARTDPAPCAWCGNDEGLVGEIDSGGIWWICRCCYVIETHEQPWIPDNHAEEFARGLAWLRRAVAERSATTPVRLWPHGNGPYPHGGPFLLSDSLDQPDLWVRYDGSVEPVAATQHPSRAVLADDLDRLAAVPGYVLMRFLSAEERDLRDVPRAWKVDHSGEVHVMHGSMGDDDYSQLSIWWWPEDGDPLAALATREASAVLVWLDPSDDVASAPAPSARELWVLREVSARYAAATLPSHQRKQALDALCGVFLSGDPRRDVLPAPEDMAAARWPLPASTPLSPDHRRRFPTARLLPWQLEAES